MVGGAGGESGGGLGGQVWLGQGGWVVSSWSGKGGVRAASGVCLAKGGWSGWGAGGDGAGERMKSMKVSQLAQKR